MRKIAAALVLLTGLIASMPAQASVGRLRVVPGEGTKAPSFVFNVVAEPSGGTPIEVARAHLRSNVALYRIADPDRRLRVLEEIVTADGATVRFGQIHRGVPVFGAQYLVHMRKAGSLFDVQSVNGRYFTGLRADTIPNLAPAVAQDLAVRRVRPIVVSGIERNGLTVLPFGEGVLAYHFTLRGHRYGTPVRFEVMINAHNGAVALSYNNMQSDGPVAGTGTRSHGDSVPLNVYQRGSRFELRDQVRAMFVPPNGQITTHDAQGTPNYVGTDANITSSSTSSFTGTHSSSGVVDAHYGAGLVYEYYLALGRNSLDGNGGNIVSTANVADFDGGPLYNAFWDGEQMIYGNPDPSELHPLSGDLDVVGHELTHGVIENSANLVYLSQPGAMNEAYADYFGNAIDVDNSAAQSPDVAGFIGEDLCKVPQPQNWFCPLRDLNDGATVANYVYMLVDIATDNGGVHLNSPIFAGALWDIREALGGPRADAIVYKTLSEFNTPLDEFVDGHNAIVAAAQALGATPAEIGTIDSAFSSRGIVDGWDELPGGGDGRVLVEDVVPYGTLAIDPPAASGSRFAVGDLPDKRNPETQEIFVGNIDGSGSIQRVSDPGAASTTNDEMPDISGKTVVWAHATANSDGSLDFDLQKSTVGGSVKKLVGGRGLQWFAAVDGNTTVWEDTRSGQTDVWMKRGSAAPVKVAASKREEYVPQVSGDWVAWWDFGTQSRSPSIGVRNVESGKSFTIRSSNAATLIGPPALGPDYVAWFEDSNGDGFGAIRYTKFKSDQIVTLVKESNDFAPLWAQLGSFPTLSANGKIVAYTNDIRLVASGVPVEEVGRDVFFVALSGGGPKFATDNRGDQAFQAVAGGTTVLWLDGSRGQTDLVTNS